MRHLVLIVLILAIVPAAQAFNTGNYYYAYGDSITRSTGYGDLPADGSANYALQMRDMYDPCAPAGHNTDGGGQWSGWGWANIETHINTSSFPSDKRPVVIVMFGVNDQKLSIVPRQYATEMIWMQRYIEGNGSYAVPVLPTLVRNGTLNFTWENQSYWLQQVEKNLTRNNIWFIKGYDAVDSIPFNDQLDQFNQTNYAEGIHPNVTGQRMIADYIWTKLQEREKK